MLSQAGRPTRWGLQYAEGVADDKPHAQVQLSSVSTCSPAPNLRQM